MAFRNPPANFGKKAKTEVNSCMLNTTVKRSRELERGFFLFRVFFLKKAKSQLPHSVGKGGQKESWCSFLRVAYHQNITGNNISQQHRGEEPALCSPPKPGDAALLERATSSAKAPQSQRRRTPSPPSFCCMLAVPSHSSRLTYSFQ